MKIMDESILFFSRISLKILSASSLHFMGIRVFIVVCIRNAKSQFQPNRAFWRLKLATGMSCELTAWLDQKFCPVVLQLVEPFRSPACFTRVPPLATYQSRASRKTLLECTHLEFSSHSLTHYPYINPTKIQGI